MEMVDRRDLKSLGVSRAGSSPVVPTNCKRSKVMYYSIRYYVINMFCGLLDILTGLTRIISLGTYDPKLSYQFMHWYITKRIKAL